MPHMPDYNCTPPKGGKLSKYVYLCVLILIVVICAKIGAFIAEYLVWFLIAAGLAAGFITYRFARSVWQALHAKTWNMNDASVMSKHDAEIYYGGRFPLDGGRVIEGDVVSEYPRAITEGNRKRASGLPPWLEGAGEGGEGSRTYRRREATWPTLRQDAPQGIQREQQRQEQTDNNQEG